MYISKDLIFLFKFSISVVLMKWNYGNQVEKMKMKKDQVEKENVY